MVKNYIKNEIFHNLQKDKKFINFPDHKSDKKI